jgi:beta-N-acetylglucosaminidase
MLNLKHVIPILLFKDAARNSVYVKMNDSIRIVDEETIAQFKFLTQHFPMSEQNIGISH